ncbi:hypothetical protein ACFE33_01670 [Falsihalocynthiibacter sp. SS001]|uniref:hypothetical protein n=1 Tax=Falsihalocynthiibacter sp. SS001 TaxID=3349698 RepID=UPI0036D36C4D
MRQKSNYVYALASFFAAFAIGYYAQNRDGDAPIFAQNEVAEPTLVDVTSVQNTSADAAQDMPQPPAATLTLLQANAIPSTKQRMQDTLSPSPTQNVVKYSAYGVPCKLEMEATPQAAAMVAIELTASCSPNQIFELSHNGLVVSGLTSGVGIAQMIVPAMAQTSDFTAKLEDEQVIKTSVEVEEFALYDRVALQWEGDTGLEMHALEFGADYGQAGHIWNNAPRTVDFATGALGGFMTRIDDVGAPNAKRAEVYSFPSGTIKREGAVRLVVKAEITQDNCGREVAAQTLQPKSTTGIETVDLRLKMPNCDAVGDVLVLNNLLRDLKIALN